MGKQESVVNWIISLLFIKVEIPGGDVITLGAAMLIGMILLVIVVCFVSPAIEGLAKANNLYKK